jgi:hypothetical protein
MVLIPTPLLIIAWIISILLLVNSSVILVNIFDFPANTLRHVISFFAAAGVLTGFIFILAGIVRRFDLLGHRR